MSRQAPRGDAQYMLRMPQAVRQQIIDRAKANERSINSEIMEAIDAHLSKPSAHDRLEAIEQFIDRHRVMLEWVREKRGII